MEPEIQNLYSSPFERKIFVIQIFSLAKTQTIFSARKLREKWLLLSFVVQREFKCTCVTA